MVDEIQKWVVSIDTSVSSTFDLDDCLDCHTRLLDVLDLTFASGRTEPLRPHTVAEATVAVHSSQRFSSSTTP